MLEQAAHVLATADPAAKCAIAERDLTGIAIKAAASDLAAPELPARPDRPELWSPSKMPKRRLGSESGRFTLLHAIAHIEYNAINLAFDMALRFHREIANLGLDAQSFVEDWVCVGQDEARHFQMVNVRLQELGGVYGDLPAHNGLWDAAKETEDSVAARLVVAPLVLEARGLDVTPGMIEKLISVGDPQSASILQTIYTEEIGHVETGAKWFEKVCTATGEDQEKFFKSILKQRFRGILKPPFNDEARAKAGLPKQFYAAESNPG